MKRTAALIALFAAPVIVGAAPAGGTIRLEVGNVRAATGRVHVDICSQAQFLKDCAHVAEAPAHIGVTVVTLSGIPAGRYAAQVTYDENGNGKVDRALFGIPKEGVGFSNDAKIGFGPPSFAEAMFDFDGREALLRLKLRYFLGPKSPPAR